MDITLHDVVQALINAKEAGEQARWIQGDILAPLPADMLKGLAGEVGSSSAHFQNLRATAWCFPEASRALDLSWSHHNICRATSAPHGWLKRCLENAWSTRQLRKALYDAGEPGGRNDGEQIHVCPACGFSLIGASNDPKVRAKAEVDIGQVWEDVTSTTHPRWVVTVLDVLTDTVTLRGLTSPVICVDRDTSPEGLKKAYRLLPGPASDHMGAT